ncbi:hypothetical protein MKO06_08910 [Gramella sp. GC03-9]|uniref:Secreted protein n=1 Tax=Christiangramia oceanisediminis TaxID=2920386 RepID=A0A9X2KWJ6_9FLAO|nr:hypothetical protein [Gramella oceanisediminis]MCP9200025.1 hypothetical protein [Gramella oceanisediminis]
MKNYLKNIGFLLSLIFSLSLFAQQANQAFWIHEDQVKPSMMEKYMSISKNFVEQCKKHNLKDAEWNTAYMNDGTVLSITPISSLSDIQNMSFEPLREAMGDNEFQKIFEDFDKCYDRHGDYVVVLDAGLSYMPDGLNTETPGKNHRVWHRMEVSPQNLSKIRKEMTDLKQVFADKGSKMHYRIYRSGFGNVGNYFVAVISTKDAAEYATMAAENEKVIGEEGKKAFDDVFQYVEKYEVKQGGMMPDLGYKGESSTAQVTKN